ncbi:MAG: NAD(P)-binding protein [Crocinitomicaceae bacterium]|jgi:uncharacterized protein with NAD-binding domain and iron-sulfur cluster|nr:NAD(P)-binding protein [Crocinitomicaceae bacterium]
MSKKKVVIIGGGVAGMSAAHELIERGYDIEVYDRNETYVGGKARSIDYYGENRKLGADGNVHTAYETPLPGEHGFRFFPGFYKHVTDTMKRIPFEENGKTKTVFDNLTPTSYIMIARYDANPIITAASFPKSKKDLEVIINSMIHTDIGFDAGEIKFFTHRLWQLLTSCNKRKNNDYERLGWWQFLQADGASQAYQSLLVEGLTRTLVAAKAEQASTKTGGNIFLQLIYCMTDPSINTDCVLNGPTNDKWLNPWLKFLTEKGVKYHKGYEATKINIDKSESRITGVTVTKVGEKGNEQELTGDYYILATPVERAAQLMSKEMIAVDHTFQYIKDLSQSVSWMNGLQFFINTDISINKGHVICSDSEWALTCISQIQFWKNYDLSNKGDGTIKGVLSVDISDWQTKGSITTSSEADNLTNFNDIKKEVWAQLKKSLTIDGKPMLEDSMVVDWYLDRDIKTKEAWDIYVSNRKTAGTFNESEESEDPALENLEPLLVNNTNTWGLRPNANSYFKNLFLAGDYVRSNTDLATMEGANESARRAVNCLLDEDNSDRSECKIWDLHEPLLFRPLKWYDEMRWGKGLPWTEKLPWWLKGFMAFWTVFCFVEGLFALLIKKRFKDHGDLKADSRRKWFILCSMGVAVGFLVVSAWKFPGWHSAALWGFGFSGIYFAYAFIFRDKLMLRFVLFGIAAGLTELIADYWLVHVTETLFYPTGEPMLFASPSYMPFSWLVVLIQIGYLGFLINKKYSLLTSSIAVGIMGCIIIPVYEYFAIGAGWWSYDNCVMWGSVPAYIFVAEGLLMLSIPELFNRCENASLKWIPVLGIIQGLIMWLACIIAFKLIG